MAKVLSNLVAVPSLALAAAAVAFAGAALFGGDGAATLSRPASAALVAPAPEELSTAVVARDWQEVGTSPSEPTPPPVDPPKNKPPKPPKAAKPPKAEK